jgi:sugar (pentulose or hexulose) kinase
VSDPRLLAIDLGTTSCRAALYTPAGRQTASAQAGYPLHSPEPGAAEQDPADWRLALWRALGQLACEHADEMRAVAAIGASAQMNAIVLLDARGQTLGRSLSSLDQRPVPYNRRLREAARARGLEVYIGRNGTLGRLARLRQERPDEAAACAHVLEARGLVNYWLTGERAADASIGVRAWTPEAAELAGFPLESLPAIRLPWEAAGGLRTEVARELGLRPGTPVVVGSGDGACANIASGALQPGQGCITLGTTGVARLVLHEPTPFVDDLPTFAFPFGEQGYWLGGGLYPATACLQWLRGLLDRGGRDEDTAWLGALLPEVEALPPGADGLTFLPFLFGLGRPTRESYGTLKGLRFSHGPAHLLRATFEGTACALRAVVDWMARGGAAVADWRATGGGMQIGLWRQIVAEVLGQRLALTNGDSSLGAAALAAVGAGLYTGLGEALQAMVHIEREVVPVPERADAYQRVYADYVAAGLPIGPSG